MPPAPANVSSHRFSRPRPKLRKAAKWGTLILSILLITASAVSVHADFGYFSPVNTITGMDQGSLMLGWDRDPSTSAYRGWAVTEPQPRSLRWAFGIMNTPQTFAVFIPFWAITLPTIALTVFAWRRDAAARRRALHNHCPACGYDRAGLLTPDAVCPECGAAAPTAASAT